jgi:hypothetical protein
LRGDGAAGAVQYQERLRVKWGDGLGDGTGDEVAATAWREADDKLHRARRLPDWLRLSAAQVGNG